MACPTTFTSWFSIEPTCHTRTGYLAAFSTEPVLQQIKGRSSKWINDTFQSIVGFAWQEGYGGFTVSKSAVPDVKSYIARQKEHHLEMDFKTEFLELLRRHGIEFDAEAVFK
jgi:Transposase IS200 like.